MKTNIFITVILCILFSSCKSANKNANSNEKKQQLEGEWELNYINYPQQKSQELYSRGIPLIRFDTKQNIVSGNNGCNSFTGKFNINGNTIDFKGPMTATKMYCEGQGENVFMQNLGKSNSFVIAKDGKELQLMEKNSLLMRFIKK